jgi:hypothetical protein
MIATSFHVRDCNLYRVVFGFHGWSIINSVSAVSDNFLYIIARRWRVFPAGSGSCDVTALVDITEP